MANSRPTSYVWKLKAPISRSNWDANVVNAVTKVLENYNGNILAKKLGNFGSRFALAVVKAGHLLEDDIVGDQTGRVNPHKPISLTNGSFGKLGLNDAYGSQTLEKIFKSGGHFIDATLDSRDFEGVVTKGGKGIDIEPDYFYLIPPTPSKPNGEIGIIELKVGYGKKDKGQEAIQLRRAAVLFLKWAAKFWPGKNPLVKLYFVGWSAQTVNQIDFNEDPNLNPSAYPVDEVPIYILTGKGCCDLLGIDYKRAITELRKYAPAAKNYIFSTVKGLSRLYNNQKRALTGLPRGTVPRLPARNTVNIHHTFPSNLFMRKNSNGAANIPKNQAQSILSSKLRNGPTNLSVKNIQSKNNIAKSFNIMESKSASGKALGGVMKGLAENQARTAAAAALAEQKRKVLTEGTMSRLLFARKTNLNRAKKEYEAAFGPGSRLKEAGRAKARAALNRAQELYNLQKAANEGTKVSVENIAKKVNTNLIKFKGNPIPVFEELVKYHTNANIRNALNKRIQNAGTNNGIKNAYNQWVAAR